MRTDFWEHLRYVMIFAIIFSFLGYVVFCIYDSNKQYDAKIERITRTEYVLRFPDGKRHSKQYDEVELK